MAATTILRNSIVPAFPVRTSLIGKGSGHDGQTGLAFAHVKFQQSVETGVNNSVQLAPQIPANSASPGVAGTEISDATTGTLYVCMAANKWFKFVGSAF